MVSEATPLVGAAGISEEGDSRLPRLGFRELVSSPTTCCVTWKSAMRTQILPSPQKSALPVSTLETLRLRQN